MRARRTEVARGIGRRKKECVAIEKLTTIDNARSRELIMTPRKDVNVNVNLNVNGF